MAVGKDKCRGRPDNDLFCLVERGSIFFRKEPRSEVLLQLLHSRVCCQSDGLGCFVETCTHNVGQRGVEKTSAELRRAQLEQVVGEEPRGSRQKAGIGRGPALDGNRP